LRHRRIAIIEALEHPSPCRRFHCIRHTTEESSMNWDRVEGNWKQVVGKVQQKWGKLTADDINLIEGKRTELTGRLQERYGIARDDAERQIDDWLKTIN
jgi:uncharacterized protein YjbJ (UPF0337 family)